MTKVSYTHNEDNAQNDDYRHLEGVRLKGLYLKYFSNDRSLFCANEAIVAS